MAGQYLTPFDSVFWHCEVGEPTHEAPDGSLYFQKGFPDGDIWLRRNQIWVRLGGAAEVLVVPTVAQARKTGHTGYHPAIICQTHGGGVDGLTPRYDDGGGRLFFWDQLDTTSPDNGGTIIRTSTTGAPGTLSDRCYKANVSGPVPITWFGAISDARAVIDAAITSGTNQLSSATAAWNVGDIVIVNGAALNPITGTVATTAGSKNIVGTGTKFERELWQPANVTIGGTPYQVDWTLTGTYELNSNVLTGFGTKFTTELYVGALIGVYNGNVVAIFGGTRTGTFTLGETATQATSGATGIVVASTAGSLTIRRVSGTFNGANTITGGTSGATFTVVSASGDLNGSQGVTAHKRKVISIANDTSAIVTTCDTQQVVAGCSAVRFWYGDSTLVGGTRAAMTRLLLRPAPSSTASGLTMLGPPKTMVGKVASVAGTVATITAVDGSPITAGVTVTGALCHMGTGAKAAIEATLDAHDHVRIPSGVTGIHEQGGGRFNPGPGAYIVEGEIEIPFGRTGCEIQWDAGAQLYMAGSFVISSPQNILKGNSTSFAFGGGEGHDYNHIAHINYLGPPSKPIIYIGATGVTAAGSGVFGLKVRQRIDVDVLGTDTAFAGTGGVTGVRFGTYDPTGAATGGKLGTDICVIDCYHGISIGGGCQTYVLRDVQCVRYNNGYAGAYSYGVGIGVGADSLYEANGAACTAGLIDGTILIQGFRIGVQISNEYTHGPMVGTTDVIGKVTIENDPPIFACYTLIGGSGKIKVTDQHDENETNTQRELTHINVDSNAGTTTLNVIDTTGIRAGDPVLVGSLTVRVESVFAASVTATTITTTTPLKFTHTAAQNDFCGLDDGWTFVGVQVGGPSVTTEGLAEELILADNYINGAPSSFALYGFQGLTIENNHIDNQGSSQDAAHLSAFGRNFGGGLLRAQGRWKHNLKAGGGLYNTPNEIWPSYTGFDEVWESNQDGTGVLHTRQQFIGHTYLDFPLTAATVPRAPGALHAPVYVDEKTFFDSTRSLKTINFGNATATTIAVDSASGQNIVNVASTVGLVQFSTLTIGIATAREENVVIDYVLNGTQLQARTNLAFTHTAVQADSVRYLISNHVAWDTSFTWTLPDGGYTPNFYIDGGALTILPKYLATALVDKLTGISINWNVWNGATSASVSTNFRADLRVLAHNPLHTNVSFTYRGLYMFEADDLGQLWLGAETLGPAVLYGTGDPNGVRTAPPSSIYFRTDDGTTWTKLTGTGNTGWVMMAAGSFVPTTRTVFGTSPIRINGGASATLAADITISALLVTNLNSGVATAITGVHPVIFSSLNGTDGTWNTFTGLGIVPSARTLTGTTPIRIDGGASGDLTANRTISALEVTNATAGIAPIISAASTLLWSAAGTSSAWATLATIGIVPTSRTLTTTFPIRIDGGASADFSANRTIALATGTDGFVLTMVSGAPAWAAPAGGFVPTSRSLITVGPIAIDGTPGGTANLSADRTLSVLDATTSNIGVVQLADDLAGTATAPDVIAATGASGTFTIRCVTAAFASNGTISTASGGTLFLNSAGTLLATSGSSAAIVFQPSGSNLLTLNPTGQLVIENVTTGIGSQPGSLTIYSAAGRPFWWGSNSGAQSVDWTCNSASTATAGGGQTVPGSVAEYMTIFFAGNTRKIPLFSD